MTYVIRPPHASMERLLREFPVGPRHLGSRECGKVEVLTRVGAQLLVDRVGTWSAKATGPATRLVHADPGELGRTRR